MSPLTGLDGDGAEVVLVVVLAGAQLRGPPLRANSPDGDLKRACATG